MTAEDRLEFIIRHRGEACIEIYMCKLAAKLDAEIVEEAMNHIVGGYYSPDDPEGYADSGENPLEVFERQVCKNCYALKRERKIADNREHQRKLKLRRGVIVNA